MRTRTIGTDELRNGWKSDYDCADGRIELEFPFAVRADARPVCDLKADDGTEIAHTLVLELIVAEEFINLKRAAARMLYIGILTTTLHVSWYQ